jgi:hypothetical protein
VWDIPDRQKGGREDGVLIHVFQVEVAEPGVGAQQLIEPLKLGVIKRPIAPTGEQFVAQVIRRRPCHQ